MVYSVKVTESAERDLDEIVGYIVQELCNPQAAAHLLDEIGIVYLQLARTPECYPSCTHPLLRQYRKVTIMGYVLIYRVEGDTVYVERFFSQLEDYAHKL